MLKLCSALLCPALLFTALINHEQNLSAKSFIPPDAEFNNELEDLYIDIPDYATAPFYQGQVLGQLGTENNFPLAFYSDQHTDLINVASNGTITVVSPTLLNNYIIANEVLEIDFDAFDGENTVSSKITLASKSGGVGGQVRMYIKASDGTIYRPTNRAELLIALRDMQTNGTKITEMIIKGHGWTSFIQCGEGEDDLIMAPNGQILIGDEDCTQLFRDITDGNSQIYFRGCYTYQFAVDFQAVLNNGATCWGAVRYVIGIPGTLTGIGIYR